MFETPITVVGNIVNDPHGRRVGDQEVIKFRVASNSRRRTADGTWEAGNSLFVKLIEDMRTILEEHSLALAKAPHRRKAASVERSIIYDAIVRRDPEAAGAAMAAHLDAAEQTFALLGSSVGL